MTDMTLENALSAIESEADNIGGEYHYVASRLCEAVESIRDHLAKAAQPVAYRYALSTGKWTVFISKARAKFLSDEGAVVEPLYAAPPTAASAQPVEAVDGNVSALDEEVRLALQYSRNHAEASPYLTHTGKEHILGLCTLVEKMQAALAHPRPTGDAIAEVAIVGWAWLLVDERTGRDYGRGFSWGEAKPDIPARAGTHYDYRALIGREKAIAASGDCNAFIHSDRGLLHDLGAHVVVDVVDVEQQAAPLVQEVPVRGARLSGDEGLTASTGEQAGEVAWTKKAAEFIEKKAQSYADEFGRDDMGSISFGAGRGADKMEEYWMSLIDLAEDFRKLGGKCQVPPDGWECSRAVGHDGPCAASPTASEDLPHGTKLYAQPRLTVPDGYRLVPVEPTDDMCRNVREKIGIGSNVAHHVWHWMIAAAPDGEVGL